MYKPRTRIENGEDEYVVVVEIVDADGNVIESAGNRTIFATEVSNELIDKTALGLAVAYTAKCNKKAAETEAREASKVAAQTILDAYTPKTITAENIESASIGLEENLIP